MRSQMRGDGVRSPVSPPSRSSSISSVGSPATARFTLSQPPHIELAPAYVAADAASELVSHLHAHPRREPSDVNPPSEERTAVLAEDALVLINTFLDFLVFNVLALARSSALDPIRAAVEHIVKGKLGQQAVKSGEYELEELMNEDDETSMHNERDPDAQWDADLVWRRTRLKIMTYMRLSEVEDEDEEDELEDELAHDDTQRGSRFSQRAGLVATIFLTSALERIAEQCIKDSGETAYNRISVSRPGTRDGSEVDDDDLLIVTEQDVKKLALSQLTGRLWRQWKHTLPRTSPRTTPSPWRTFHERTHSNASDAVGGGSRRPSNALVPIRDSVDESQELTADSNSQARTPRSPRPTSDQTANRRVTRHAPRRSRSFGRFPVAVPARAEAGSWQSQSPRAETAAEPRPTRMRSNSLPSPAVRTSRLSVPSQSEDEPVSASAVEQPSHETQPIERPQRDMAVQAASAAVRGAEPDPVAAPSRRLSREARRSLRNSREVRRSLVDSHESGTEKQTPVPPSHTSDSTATPPAPDDDDEYDPFRADAPVPPPVKAARAAASNKSSASAPPPVQETLRKMSQRDSMDASPHRTPDATATLAGGAVSSAILGTTSQRKTKKPAPLDMSATGPANSRTPSEPVAGETRQSRPADTATTSKIRTQEARDMSAKEVSPAQTSAGRADESRTPSSSKLQRMAASDTSSATYETPRGSPNRFEVIGEHEERPAVQQRSSDPSATMAYVKPVSPKQKRSGQQYTRIAESNRENERNGGLSPRSEKEFNEMMSGNETVKRSLTPKTLTEIEAVDSPRLRQQHIKSTADPPSPVGTKFPIAESRGDSPPRSSEAAGQRPRKSSNIGAIRQAAEAKAAEVGSPPTPKSPRNGYVVRDAREQPYRTNDMADFLRSTGPSGPDQAPRLLGTNTSAGKAPASSRTSPTYQKPSVKSIVPNTSRLAAKKKTGPFRPERQANDDLISFLNEGPPGAHVSKTRSMETTNSRTTDTGLGAISPANRSSSQMSQSINESINSHSGLLSKHAGSSGPAERSQMNTSAPRANVMPKAVEGGAPMRKQRRNKDPYAIDSDDEDEDILTGLPPKDEPGDSMGLVDFLRSTAPPDDNFPSGPGSGQRMGSSPPPPPNAPMGTSATATGGPRPLHKPIPSNEEIKRDPRSDLALPHFLKEDRAVRPRQSYDSNHSARKSSKSAEPGRGGMRGLFKRIGVNG